MAIRRWDEADVAIQAAILLGRVLEALEMGTPARYLQAQAEMMAYVHEHGDPQAWAEAVAERAGEAREQARWSRIREAAQPPIDLGPQPGEDAP